MCFLEARRKLLSYSSRFLIRDNLAVSVSDNGYDCTLIQTYSGHDGFLLLLSGWSYTLEQHKVSQRIHGEGRSNSNFSSKKEQRVRVGSSCELW